MPVPQFTPPNSYGGHGGQPLQYPPSPYEQPNALAGPSFSPPGGITPNNISAGAGGYGFPAGGAGASSGGAGGGAAAGGAALMRVTTIGSAGGAMGSAQRLLGFSTNLKQFFRRSGQGECASLPALA